MSFNAAETVYRDVAKILTEHPLTSATPEEIQRLRARRMAEIDRVFGHDPKQRDLALEYSQQKLLRDLASLNPRRGEACEHEHWKVIRPGDVLGGKLTFIRKLSRPGGISEVWEARTRLNQQALAIKYISPTKITHNASRVALALQELQQMLKVHHRNIVDVYDGGWLEDTYGQRVPFVMMEMIDGCTLEEWAKYQRTRLLSGPDAARVAAKIVHVLAKTVEFLHTPGEEDREPILHLDLKPTNGMVLGGLDAKADEATLKLIDFGAFKDENPKLVIGTPGYTAPERWTHPDAAATPQCDVHSLGGILYYLLAGEHPEYDCETLRPIFHYSKIADESLRTICAKATGSQPRDRFQSAQQLAESLAAWIGHLPIPHIGKSYSWLQKERLLLKRARNANNLADHIGVVARVALALCVAPLLMPVFHCIQVARKTDPLTAFSRVNNAALVYAFVLLAGGAVIVKLNRHTVRMTLPTIAMLVSFIGLIVVVSPANFGSTPNWREVVHSNLAALFVIGVLHVCYGTLASEWWPLLLLGWIEIAAGMFLRPLYESRISDYAMPVVFCTFEVIGCLLVARALWKPSVVINALRLPQQFDAGSGVAT